MHLKNLFQRMGESDDTLFSLLCSLNFNSAPEIVLKKIKCLRGGGGATVAEGAQIWFYREVEVMMASCYFHTMKM